jgi:hypothetical protein
VQGSTMDGTWDSQEEAISGRDQLTPFSTHTHVVHERRGLGGCGVAVVGKAGPPVRGSRVQAARCCKE